MASSYCEVYIPHTDTEEANGEKELMKREGDREHKERHACR